MAVRLVVAATFLYIPVCCVVPSLMVLMSEKPVCHADLCYAVVVRRAAAWFAGVGAAHWWVPVCRCNSVGACHCNSAVAKNSVQGPPLTPLDLAVCGMRVLLTVFSVSHLGKLALLA